MKYKEIYFLTVRCDMCNAISCATVDLHLQSMRIQASEVTYAKPQEMHLE